MFEDCEIYANNENLEAIVVVSDETKPYNPFKYFADQLYSVIKTNAVWYVEPIIGNLL